MPIFHNADAWRLRVTSALLKPTPHACTRPYIILHGVECLAGTLHSEYKIPAQLFWSRIFFLLHGSRSRYWRQLWELIFWSSLFFMNYDKIGKLWKVLNRSADVENTEDFVMLNCWIKVIFIVKLLNGVLVGAQSV